MTNREFLTAVINGTITDEHITFAQNAITKLDKALEQRKNKTSPKDAEKAKADAELREQILGVLTADLQIAADIAPQVGVSTSKCAAQLRKLVADCLVVKGEVNVPKKGKTQAYALAPTQA